MASLPSLATTLPKRGQIGALVIRSPWRSRVFVPVTRRHFQASDKAKEVAGEASKTAQDATEKAKQTVQDAWGSVKDTTQKIKDTVSGKAEESKEFVEKNAETVKRSMNSKN